MKKKNERKLSEWKNPEKGKNDNEKGSNQLHEEKKNEKTAKQLRTVPLPKKKRGSEKVQGPFARAFAFV